MDRRKLSRLKERNEDDARWVFIVRTVLELGATTIGTL